jgi:hypothetical protein
VDTCGWCVSRSRMSAWPRTFSATPAKCQAAVFQTFAWVTKTPQVRCATGDCSLRPTHVSGISACVRSASATTTTATWKPSVRWVRAPRHPTTPKGAPSSCWRCRRWCRYSTWGCATCAWASPTVLKCTCAAHCSSADATTVALWCTQPVATAARPSAAPRVMAWRRLPRCRASRCSACSRSAIQRCVPSMAPSPLTQTPRAWLCGRRRSAYGEGLGPLISRREVTTHGWKLAVLLTFVSAVRLSRWLFARPGSGYLAEVARRATRYLRCKPRSHGAGSVVPARGFEAFGRWCCLLLVLVAGSARRRHLWPVRSFLSCPQRTLGCRYSSERT